MVNVGITLPKTNISPVKNCQVQARYEFYEWYISCITKATTWKT